MNDREIKRRIRVLRKLKRDTRVKSEARREINRKIRELKKDLNKGVEISPEKTELIEKINAVYKHYNDLRKFTIKQLQFHLEKIIGKKRK